MNKMFIILTLSVLLLSKVSAQNITNTLGTNGTFSIKDQSTTYLSLNQTDGSLSINRNLMLSNTGAQMTGFIFKGGQRFIHNFQGPGGDKGNLFIGINSGNFALNNAARNTSIGSGTMGAIFDGVNNSAFGYFSLTSNFQGSNNSSFGSYSMYSNNFGNNNSAYGSNSLYNNGSGSNNSAFGYNSLYSNSIGLENSAFGFESLKNNAIGDGNSAFGSYSLWENTSGESNSAFGVNSLVKNTIGNNNSAFGLNSLSWNATGTENSSFGMYSLYNNSTGWHNSAFGFDALRNNTSGWQNTAVGHHSLLNSIGNYNTALGYNAGSTVTSGWNLTLIGIDANPSSPTAGDQITLGNGFVTSLRCNVTTITSLSDARDKKNIKDLSLGLDFISKLKPRQFNWDKREWYDKNISDGSRMQETPTAGFVAQELDEAQSEAGVEWLNLVLKDNPEKWEATPGNLLPIMVKAIQELKAENDELRAQVEILMRVEERLTKLEETLIQKDNSANIKLAGEK